MLSCMKESSPDSRTYNMASRPPNPPVGLASVHSTSAFEDNPIRALAFKMGLALVFLRFSLLHQLLTVLLGVNLYLLYVVGVPALVGLVVSGGIQRTFRGRPAVYLVGFAVCLVMVTPFSYWKGGSASLLLSYFRVDFIMLFVVGGLVVTWRECKLVMCTIAWAAAVNLLAARLFLKEDQGERASFGFGSVGDPNDFATHLLLVLPFLLWVGFTAKSFALRLIAILGVAYGCVVILSTGSRGGLVGMAVAILYFLFRATTFQRMALVIASPIAMLVIVSVVPARTLERITSFSTSADASAEALASSDMRQYLLTKSIEYTVEHPLVGVGPGQFSAYEGKNNRLGGTTHGSWHQTHNTFTQVSSECGLPAFLFFLASIISSFLLLNSTYRQTSTRPGCQDMRSMVFCIMLGMTGFVAGIFFLSFAYFCYVPALGGLAISVSRGSQEEVLSRNKSTIVTTFTSASGNTSRWTGVNRFTGLTPTRLTHGQSWLSLLSLQ